MDVLIRKKCFICNEPRREPARANNDTSGAPAALCAASQFRGPIWLTSAMILVDDGIDRRRHGSGRTAAADRGGAPVLALLHAPDRCVARGSARQPVHPDRGPGGVRARP